MILQEVVRAALVFGLVFGLVMFAYANGDEQNGVTGLQLKAGRGRVLVVTGVIPGTPAELVGLRKGDKIVAIADKPLTELKLKTAVKMLKGAPGTKLQLTIKRGNSESFDIILKRAKPISKIKPVERAQTSTASDVVKQTAPTVTSTTKTSSTQ